MDHYFLFKVYWVYICVFKTTEGKVCHIDNSESDQS